MAQVGRAVSRREKLLRKGGLKAGGKVVVCLAVLVAVAAVAGFLLVGNPLSSGSLFEIERSGAAVEEAAAQEDQDAAVQAVPLDTKILVHVDGQVAAPGVYELLGDDARVNDAILAAGGLAADADTSTLNLASKVADGEKIYVPSINEVQVEALAGDAGSSDAATSTGNGLVNINTATADQLQTLSGVGEATAKAIVEDRETHGQFTSIEDLMRVSGIGEKKFAKIKDRICV